MSKEKIVKTLLSTAVVGLLTASCLGQIGIVSKSPGVEAAKPTSDINLSLDQLRAKYPDRFFTLGPDAVHAVPIDQGSFGSRSLATIYSAMSAPYYYVTFTGQANTNYMTDDYTSIMTSPTGPLRSAGTPTGLRFVGGVTTAAPDNVLGLAWYDTGNNLINAATVALGTGDFIYSITMPANFNIPNTGTVAVYGGTAGTTIHFYVSTTPPTVGTNVAATGTYAGYYAFTEYNIDCPNSGDPVAITQQPPATQTSQCGTTLTLTCAATGNPAPSYQWYKGANAVSGQTNATLSIPNCTFNDGGTYTCMVSNACTTLTTTASTVTVANCPQPQIVGATSFGYPGGSAVVSGQVYPSGTHPITNVHANATTLGGASNVQMFDDGPGGGHGDAVAGDNIYSATVSIANGFTLGTYSIPLSVTDNQPQTGTGTATVNVVSQGDECQVALTAVVGDNTFSNATATTSPNPSTVCTGIGNDLWYSFVAPSTGSMTVSSCGGTTADSLIIVYDGCGGAELACDDDGCGTVGGPSTVRTCVTSGHTYMIRVGGWGGAIWSGTFNIAIGPPTPAVAAPDICVTTGSVAVARALVQLGCPAQTVSSATANFSALGGGTATLNDAGTAPDATTGDNSFGGFSATPITSGPGTYTVPVTVTFSGAGPITVNANVHVSTYIEPAGATDEGDGCGVSATDTVNGGCNFTPNTFTTAALCTDITGAAASQVGSRDLDWWHFDVTDAGTYTISGQVQFPDPLIWVTNGTCPIANIYGQADAVCNNFSFTATLPGAGTYTLIIAPSGTFDGSSSCTGNNARYHFRIEPPTGCGQGLCCRNDYNGDGDVGTDADIEAFFACLGGTCCATCPPNADFNCDGDVGTDADIESFFRVLAGGAC